MPLFDRGKGLSLIGIGKHRDPVPEPLVQCDPGPEFGDLRKGLVEGLPQLRRLRLDNVLQRVKERTVPVTHLLSVAETPELRKAFNEALPEITEFWTRVTLNEGLWNRITVISGRASFKDSPRGWIRCTEIFPRKLWAGGGVAKYLDPSARNRQR